MKRADLHVHTIASGDSTLQPEDVVRQAVAAGLSAIAFTDHDGTGSIELGGRLADQYGIDFLAGIELSSSWRGELAHVLGYFPRGAGPALRQYVVDAIWRTTRHTALSLLERLRPLGFDISVEEYDAKAAEMGCQGSSLYQLAYERGYVADVGAYQTRVAALRIEKACCAYPPVPEVVAAIHNAGGIAVLAHPFAAPEFHEFDEGDIETLAGQGLAGVEVFHPRHLEQGVVACYAAVCDRLGLLQTGGSDSHGKATPPNRRYVGGMTCDWDVVRRSLEAPLMSEKSIAQKLFLKPGHAFVLLGAPAGFEALLGDLPAGVSPVTTLAAPADVILCFATTKAQLAGLLPALRAGLKPAGILWIAYPKGTSKVPTDLNRDIIVEDARPGGWQGVAIFSIDAVWSALRLKAV